MSSLDNMIPDLQASFICEDVRLEAGGSHTIVGILNAISTNIVPLRLNKLCVWTRWVSGVGDYTQITRIVLPDESVLAEVKTRFNLSHEESHTTNVNILGNIEFPQEGIYHVEIFLDEEMKLRFPIRLLVNRSPVV